jgi:hypothetical protein
VAEESKFRKDALSGLTPARRREFSHISRQPLSAESFGQHAVMPQIIKSAS